MTHSFTDLKVEPESVYEMSLGFWSHGGVGASLAAISSVSVSWHSHRLQNNTKFLTAQQLAKIFCSTFI